MTLALGIYIVGVDWFCPDYTLLQEYVKLMPYKYYLLFGNHD